MPGGIGSNGSGFVLAATMLLPGWVDDGRAQIVLGTLVSARSAAST